MKSPQNKSQTSSRIGRSPAKPANAAAKTAGKPKALAGGSNATEPPIRQRRPAEPGINYIEKRGKAAGALAFDSFTEIGDGYAIVRMKRSKRRDEKYILPNLPSMKPFRISQVQKILKKFTMEQPAVAAPVDSNSAALQVDNETFTASLHREAATWRARLHQEGKLLASAQLSERQGVSRQSISKAVADHRLFALDGPGGRKLYPAFFGDATFNKRDLERTSQALGSLPGAFKWQFFTTPAHSLGGRTPVEALSKGQLDDVLRAAAGFLERELGN